MIDEPAGSLQAFAEAQSTWSTDPCYASSFQVPGTAHYGIAVPQK